LAVSIFLPVLWIPTASRRQWLLEELFAEAETQEFRGALTVTAEGGEIIGSALQIGSKRGQVAALPVKEVR
jgi:hypothetical protein